MTKKNKTFKGIVKSGKPQNVVQTNKAQNMAAAILCDTLRDAEVLFRALQHANNMGTTGDDYSELHRAWVDKVGAYNYVHNSE